MVPHGVCCAPPWLLLLLPACSGRPPRYVALGLAPSARAAPAPREENGSDTEKVRGLSGARPSVGDTVEPSSTLTNAEGDCALDPSVRASALLLLPGDQPPCKLALVPLAWLSRSDAEPPPLRVFKSATTSSSLRSAVEEPSSSRRERGSRASVEGDMLSMELVSASSRQAASKLPLLATIAARCIASATRMRLRSRSRATGGDGVICDASPGCEGKRHGKGANPGK